MATNKQLEKQVSDLEKRVGQLSMRNSQLLDEVTLLKGNLKILAKDVAARFEVVQKRFQGR